MKYDVSIDMPEVLDLSVLRGFGLQEGEEELPETTAPPPKGKKTIVVLFISASFSSCVRDDKNAILFYFSSFIFRPCLFLYQPLVPGLQEICDALCSEIFQTHGVHRKI